jgi:2,4-dienoyl-CoA reductase-like NADH-dependent reductase (Old Yellow Enzyme family)
MQTPNVQNESLYPSLLSPFTLAGKRLRNRLVHASMTTLMGENTRVTDRLVQYHANRARGGAALIVTEPLSMAPHQTIPYKVRVWNDDNLDGLKRWADAVESEDCRLLGQIQDPGRGRHAPGKNPTAVGASYLPDDISWTVPHALSAEELRRMIADFAQSAQRLQRCGFSGVEISAGHGHLFHQFLSPWSNARDDEYGGDLEGRTRFLAELIGALRATCGREFIVGVKLPGNDGVRGGIGPEEAARIARHITRAGNVDYVCFAQGSHARSLELHVPDGNGPRAPYMPLIRELHRATCGVPVVALGRITDPAEADSVIERGDAELVALGRALVTDPAWLNKAARGRAHDIRYCVSCNTCWDTIVTQHRPIACDNNPRVGRNDEVDWWPDPAAVRKRVVIVGAGVAGMEAAWVAAARGHHVTVYGRSSEVGGKTRLRAQLPGGEALSSIYDYQHAEAIKAGARFELGVTIGAADLIALHPDAVVLACGAEMLVPPWVPPEMQDANLVPDLRSAMSALRGHAAHQPGSAVIFDTDHTEGTYAAAELLHAVFDRVFIITPRESIAQDMPLVTRQGILRRFHEKRIRTLVFAEPRWSENVEDGTLEYVNVYNGDAGAIEDVAFLAYSSPRAPQTALAAPLRAAGIDVRLVGDCVSPRGILAATAEGHDAGNAI